MNQLDDTLMSGYVRFPTLARFTCCVYAGDAPHGLEHYVSAYLQESLEHLTIIPQAHPLEDDRGPHGPQVPRNLAGLQLSGPPGMQGFPPPNSAARQLPLAIHLPLGMPNLLPHPSLMSPPGVVEPDEQIQEISQGLLQAFYGPYIRMLAGQKQAPTYADTTVKHLDMADILGDTGLKTGLGYQESATKIG
ncbi:hypothetical protein D6D06_07170 [Aureobasidium pullulans]|nr:hypothetical protein D6D06_07170 [Aureobasidium pullulans]